MRSSSAENGAALVSLVSVGTELYPRHAIEQIGHVGTVLEELIGAEALAKIELLVMVHSITSP